MEKLFENKTEYNQDVYLEFLRFHSKKYNFGYYAYTVLWAFLFLLCIIICFDTNMRIQGVLITIMLIAFLAYRIIYPQITVKKELSSEKITSKNVNTFEFYDKDIKIINQNGSFIYKYFSFRRVFETDTYFYLYVTKENAFIISKKAFSLGTAEDFSKFIKSKCKLKYKAC